MSLSFEEILNCFPLVQGVCKSDGRLNVSIRPVYSDARMNIVSETDAVALRSIQLLSTRCGYSYLRVEVNNDGTETWSWLRMD